MKLRNTEEKVQIDKIEIMSGYLLFNQQNCRKLVLGVKSHKVLLL